MLGEDPNGSRPFSAQHAPMNEPLQMARSLATLTLPLDEMRNVGRHFGATLNDLSVTIIDEGLHRYLTETGRAFPHRLVAFCPMSLRDEGDNEAATKASAMFVHLGEHDATAVERIAQVVATMRKAKKELRSMSKDAAMMYAVAVLGVAEVRTTTRASRAIPPLANLVISNVPGGREKMYLNGATLLGTYPVTAIAASIGLNATLTRYHDRMDFGFLGNGATMYDLRELARHVADAPVAGGCSARPLSRRERTGRFEAFRIPDRAGLGVVVDGQAECGQDQQPYRETVIERLAEHEHEQQREQHGRRVTQSVDAEALHDLADARPLFCRESRRIRTLQLLEAATCVSVRK